LGAKEKNGFAQVDGLDEGHIVGLKKNFWDMAHNPQKVSVPLVSEGQVHEEEVNGAWVLVAEVPRALRLASDGVTRLEYTPAHLSVREALANCLIHASYTQIGSIVVERWKQRFKISNPGGMLVSVDHTPQVPLKYPSSYPPS